MKRGTKYADEKVSFQFKQCPQVKTSMAFTPMPGVLTPLTSTFIPHCALCRQALPTHSQVTMRSKREKRARPSMPSETPSKATPPPPRIDVESSTLSLRQQLKLARAAAATDAPTKVRQRFRRKKGVDVRSGRATWQGDVDVPDGKYGWERDPILYIDAYNVIGEWPKLRKHRDRMDMDTARRLLVDLVTEFSHVRGWECVLVFDAHGNDDAEKISLTPQDVEVVYTGAETADSYIERHVYERCERGDRQVWAATSDVAQLSFSRAKGAHVMSSSLFIQEIKRAKKDTKELVERRDEMDARARMLMSNVDEETRNRLYQLRDRLDGT